MLRIVNISSPQGIVMNVFNLLPHHLLGLDYLRMASVLPQLVLLVDLVP